MRRNMLIVAAASAVLASCDRSGPAPDPAPTVQQPVAVSTPGDAKPPAPRTDLGCDYPVDGARDTVSSVLARFGKQARRATIAGPEGMELAGVVLWPGDPAREVELIIDDERPGEHIAGLRVSGEKAQWTAARLGIGDPLARVVAANGAPIGFWGFGWDYGGYVSDMGKGRLEQLPGGCTLGLRLDLDPGDPGEGEGLMGDTQIRSDARAVAGRHIFVDEISLNWR
jgi:hypothetical protein